MAQKKTTKKSTKIRNISNAQKLSIGVGLTAAAVTAAGAYFLYGSKDAEKNRKKVKSWTLKAKAEVLEVLENSKHITQEEFQQLVAGVTQAYAKARQLSSKETADFKKEMAEHWEDLVASGVVQVTNATKIAKKLAPDDAKKAVSKAGKRAAKSTKSTAKKASGGVKKATSKVTKSASSNNSGGATRAEVRKSTPKKKSS